MICFSMILRLKKSVAMYLVTSHRLLTHQPIVHVVLNVFSLFTVIIHSKSCFRKTDCLWGGVICVCKLAIILRNGSRPRMVVCFHRVER